MSTTANKHVEVTVVGAGIVGICCALSLQERGIKTLLIDRDEPGQGASFGNAGIISPWSVTPQAMPGVWKNIPKWLLDPDGPVAVQTKYLPKLLPWAIRFLRGANQGDVERISDAMETLNRSNVELYRQLLAGTGHEHLVKDSYYVHAFRKAENADINAPDYAIKAQKGAEIERIDGPELQRLEPAVSKEFKAAIIIKGQARATSPGKIATVLAEKFCSLGGEILRANVTDLARQSDGSWQILNDQQPVNCKRLVLAAGAWSAQLLKPLGVHVPMVAERGYHVRFADPGVELNHSVMDAEMKIVFSSMEEGLRAAGTSEFANLDAPPNPRRIATLASATRRMLPDMNDSQMESWMGTRPSMPDSLPCIGPVAQQDGLFAAFGHCHYGLMMAPKTGQIIADLLSSRTPNSDLSVYNIGRFTD